MPLSATAAPGPGVCRCPGRSLRLCLLAVAAATAGVAGTAAAQARVDRNFGLDAPLAPPPRSQQEIIQQLQSQPAGRTAPAATIDSNAQPASVLSGAYSVDAVSPTIYSKNVVYPTPYPLPLVFAGRVTVSTVSWQYGVQNRPPGFEAALCWSDSKHCVNVTALGSGSTDAFNGVDASKPFKLIYQVVGTGALAPVMGEAGQLIVNYRYWP